MTAVVDLPEDILTIIFSFLEAKAFLAFCQTCKELSLYRRDSAYWRDATSSTFRLPISPLLKADGARWYWLYKRLRTQTKLYTWGQGLKGNLGPGRSPQPAQVRRGQMFRGRFQLHNQPTPGRTYQRTSSSWPTEAQIPDEVGVIADLQCGGWSTSILSSQGKLYTVGLIDSLDGRIVGEATTEFKRLEYLTQSTSAIRQFSSGRRHILALTDDGEILSWDRINAKGLKVYARSTQDFGGKASRVAAGWAESSAYVPDTGIVYWTPITNNQQDDDLDGLHIKEKIIPGTARYVTGDNVVIEVLKHVVLQSWIIWLTSDGKVYACNVHAENGEAINPMSRPFEIPGYTSSARSLKDVQGQFDKFAVFTESGEVLAGHTDYIQLCSELARSQPIPDNPNQATPYNEWPDLDQLIASRPPDIPALQHNQVISIAFGDHHYHALHINGKITSYGNDPQSIGALGLGDMHTGARFRGLRTSQGFRPDARLLPQAERRGRQIWFEPEKRDWLKYMEETLISGRLPGNTDTQGNHHPALELWTPNTQKQFLFSEWVEQEGRNWKDGPLTHRNITQTLHETVLDTDDFHLDSYFALTVSAAGWHSGALVLVDEEKAHAAQQKWTIKHTPVEDDNKIPNMPGHFESGPSEPEDVYVWKIDGFPRVKLPDGSEMPGDGELRRWRGGMPGMADLGL